MATMNRAFAYLRVSGRGHINGDGFPRQSAAMKAYALAHDIRIAQVFREEGICGAIESADRPAWAALVIALQLMGAVAQYDKSQIVLKLRGARQRMKAAVGRCEGRKPYGDRDGEAAVIERMRQMRAAGMAYRKIAAALNADAVPTRTAGARWRGCTVNGILNRYRQTA